MKILIQTCLAVLFMVTTQAEAGVFSGQTVGYNYLFDEQNIVYFDPGPVAVGAGVELTGLYFGEHATVDISDSSILIDYFDSPSWVSASFNGFRVFDINNTLGDITSVTINPITNMGGLDVSRISFDANNIYVNWQGLSANPNTIVLLDVNGVNTVPEPASIAIWGLGAFGSLFAFRRKKKVTA